MRGSMSREAAAAAAGGRVSSGRPTTEEVLARALLLLLRMLASDETRVTAVAHAALTAVAAALGEGVAELVLGRPLVLHGLSQLLQQPGGPGVLQQMESQLQVGAQPVQPQVVVVGSTTTGVYPSATRTLHGSSLSMCLRATHG